MPKVSIVLPVYNGEKYIKESIDSILKQSFQDWELIVVNDCSTDSTLNIINEYARNDERIQVINNEFNMKLPKSLNIGFGVARGEYYTWTSDDNIYEENAIKEMYEYLSMHSDSPMVVANMIAIDEKGKYIREWVKFDSKYMVYTNTVGACFLYRSEVRATIGEYNCELFLVEDYEYWLRVLFHYGNIAHIDKTLYKYRIHCDSLSAEKKCKVKERLCDLRLRYLDEIVALADEDIVLELYCELIESVSISKNQRELLSKACSLISGIKAYNSDKPSIIYGAGRYGYSASTLINEVAYFADKNPKLIGTKINGIEVISIDKMKEMLENYQLIVAVNHKILFSVLLELTDMGVDSWCIIQDILAKRGMEYDQFVKL